MTVTPTYPGVYIEEVPSGVRTITGVSTSVTAFVGYARRGRLDAAVRVQSFADYERLFGGLDALSELSYAVQQFFLNGGSEALVVRTAKSAVSATVVLKAAVGGADVLRATAADEGTWGNAIRLDVDYQTTNPATTFNLTVEELATVDGKSVVARREVFRNLDPAPGKFNAVDVVNGGSRIVTLTRLGAGRPAPTGTLSNATSAFAALVAGDDMTASLNGTGLTGTIELPTPVPATPEALAASIESQLRSLTLAGKKVLANATVRVVVTGATTKALQVKTGTGAADERVTFAGDLASKTGLDADGNVNVSQYALGGTNTRAQGAGTAGNDGLAADAQTIIGSPLAKTGIYALEDADIFNLLVIPETNALNAADPAAAAATVASAAAAYCAGRRAFYLFDLPHPATNPVDTVEEMVAWLDGSSAFRHKNAAVYFPRPVIADPLNDFRPRAVPAAGTLAGLYARTDAERGVWKAPAGTDAVLRGVRQLEYKLTDAQNGTLNPLGVNCLRTLPVYGNVAWGARTLDGSDQQASEWKYVPVRRMALYLEESLYRGTKWVVFEPNDEPLWSQIRLNAGAFMHSLFLKGAFQGQTPKEAYFVRCDKTTTTQDDINRGIVNVLVGFAPLKPAEFVVIRLSQIAGQLEV